MIYYAQGSAIITADEMFQPSVLSSISKFHSELAARKAPNPIEFSTGLLAANNVSTGIAAADGGAQTDFQKIGLGLPLTVMIREVYTGKFPRGGLFGGGKDMLLTSAIKSIVSFEAKPRAINFLTKKVSSHTRMERPRATEQGTPIIFYSPALLERSLTLDLNMVFDSFPEEIFNQVGDGFTAAAGIPIFHVASIYLLAAGLLTKLIGSAGEAIFDGKPIFNSSDPIDIFFPGSPPIPPGFLLITADNVDSIDSTFRSAHHVNNSGQVVDDAGQQYNGDIPYVVISLDGTPDDQFASFTPTAASAAILSRFLGIKDGQQQPLNILIDAIKVFNDLNYRKQIDQIDEQLKTLQDGDPKKQALQDKRKALLSNILEDVLKPKN